MGNGNALMQSNDLATLITNARARKCYMDMDSLPKDFLIPKGPAYTPFPGMFSSNMRGLRSAGHNRHRPPDMHIESKFGTPSKDDEKLDALIISRNGNYRPLKPPMENSLDDFDQL